MSHLPLWRSNSLCCTCSVLHHKLVEVVQSRWRRTKTKTDSFSPQRHLSLEDGFIFSVLCGQTCPLESGAASTDSPKVILTHCFRICFALVQPFWMLFQFQDVTPFQSQLLFTVCRQLSKIKYYTDGLPSSLSVWSQYFGRGACFLSPAPHLIHSLRRQQLWLAIRVTYDCILFQSCTV